jgi:hypothetical protein
MSDIEYILRLQRSLDEAQKELKMHRAITDWKRLVSMAGSEDELTAAKAALESERIHRKANSSTAEAWYRKCLEARAAGEALARALECVLDCLEQNVEDPDIVAIEMTKQALKDWEGE